MSAGTGTTTQSGTTKGRYHLKLDLYDGSVYVFRDGTGSILKYIEWDGQGFLQGKRRAQSGTYPWPKWKDAAEWQAPLTKKEAEIASLNRQVECSRNSFA